MELIANVHLVNFKFKLHLWHVWQLVQQTHMHPIMFVYVDKDSLSLLLQQLLIMLLLMFRFAHVTQLLVQFNKMEA